MARSPRAFSLAADAITIEGALIAPALLARIAAQQAEGQAEVDYRIPKGLTLRDEIARYFRIGQALFTEFAASPSPGPGRTIAFIEELCRDVFGFAEIVRVGSRSLDGQQFPVTLEGLGGRVPIVVVPPEDALDAPSTQLMPDARRRSAASALQDWLNASDEALWGLCSNGEGLRLLRDNASLTRPAYIEADLRRIFENETFSDFATLWLLLHVTRFGQPESSPRECLLEHWRDAGQREGVTARERLAGGVEAALLALSKGFLGYDENGALRDRVRSGGLPLSDFFGQLLRLVYRLMFLLTAEDRELLHVPGAPAAARKLYAEGYSLSLLRERSLRRSAWDRHHDLWQGLLISFAGLAHGEARLGLPALGGLFDPNAIPDLGAEHLPNRALMEAVYRLAWLREGSSLVKINWRDMATEEFGSVYESLLELKPLLVEEGRAMAFAEGDEAKGHARKKTGSYYTPDSLVQMLLDSALDPVLDRVENGDNNLTEALLGTTVIDPACGSGHFLLAAGRRIATRLARARSGGIASADDYRRALRDVARICLHGVDRNPMAVELTKVALWIETVEPGKPLGFLDANIRCGDALLGVFDMTALAAGIPDAAYKPLTGDEKLTAKYYAVRNHDELRGQGSLDFTQGSGRLPTAAPLARERAALRALPEDSAEQVTEKRRRFEGARAAQAGYAWGVAADMFVAAFLLTKTGGPPGSNPASTVPTTADVWRSLSDKQAYPPLLATATKASREAHAFHWQLEFPDVMAAGGFDVVLGNPPWERIKLQEQEFFAAFDPEIATAPNAAARSRLIAALERAKVGTRERALYEAFERAKHLAEASSVFARESGQFPLAGHGDVNTYALFAELSCKLISPRGRAGVIVPTGIATDISTSKFFQFISRTNRLISLFSFENEEFIFPAVHHSFRFCLLTLGYKTAEGALAEFIFFARSALDLANSERRFTLSPTEIERVNPNTKTAPVFRTRADAALTAKIYRRVPVLVDETKGPAGNPWAVSFHTRIWHMAEDSSWFRTAAQLREMGFAPQGIRWMYGKTCYVPLYEAKMIHQFDHRWATYGAEESRDVTKSEKIDMNFEPTPRYWVPETEVISRLTAKHWTRLWLIGWRGICRSTDERTLISAVVPAVGSGDTFILMFPSVAPQLCAILMSAMNSLVCDYLVRQKFGGISLKLYLVHQIPLPPPSAYSRAEMEFIVARVLELTYTSQTMASFARDLGYTGPPFAWNENRRALLRAELDAYYASAYGLTRDELRYVLDPEDSMGPGYPSETFRVLKKSEIARFGEYRTARLVLAAWDQMNVGDSSNVGRGQFGDV